MATLGQSKANEYAILFYKMAAVPVNLGTNIPVSSPPFSAFVAHDLVQNANAHATRRFVIDTDDVQSESVLIVWLFVESTRMYVWPLDDVRRLLAKQNTPTMPFSACKVMYQVRRRDEIDPDILQGGTSSWSSPAMHDRLSYPEGVQKRLLALLQATNLTYPPSQRIFLAPKPGGVTADQWRVAYLPFTL